MKLDSAGQLFLDRTALRIVPSQLNPWTSHLFPCKCHLYLFSTPSCVLAEPDLYLFWFISRRCLPKCAQQNRVITTVPLVSLIPQAIRICRTLFSTQKKLYRVVIDSESSAGTRGLNPLDHLIMFNKRQSLPLWFIALSEPVTNPDIAQIKTEIIFTLIQMCSDWTTQTHTKAIEVYLSQSILAYLFVKRKIWRLCSSPSKIEKQSVDQTECLFNTI